MNKYLAIIVLVLISLILVNFVSAELDYCTIGFFALERTVINDINSGLVHKYNFENNLEDQIGNADFHIQAGNIEYTEGILGKGIELDGNDNLMAVNSKLKISSNLLTISFWANFNSIERGFFISKIDFNSTNKKGFGLRGNNSGLEFFTGGTGNNILNCNIPSFYNNWHHIAITTLNNGIKKIYVDGKLCNVNIAIAPKLTNNRPLLLGQKKINGVLDELKIWNRALSAEEILKEFNESSKECDNDFDCVPATCCHPNSCVSIENAPNCRNAICTLDCIPGTLDCGQGSCMCINGKCRAFFNS